jgi:hypothetical protein
MIQFICIWPSNIYSEAELNAHPKATLKLIDYPPESCRTLHPWYLNENAETLMRSRCLTYGKEQRSAEGLRFSFYLRGLHRIGFLPIIAAMVYHRYHVDDDDWWHWRTL